MQRPTRWMRGAFAHAALALAGAVAAWAASRSGQAWTADPEEQFLLDVNIRQLRLGDGVRAYQTPEGTCVVFGDFLTTLDLPMKIDLADEKGFGLGVPRGPSIDIDQAAGTRPLRRAAGKAGRGRGPRDARRLVRRQRRARPLVQARRQAGHLRARC